MDTNTTALEIARNNQGHLILNEEETNFDEILRIAAQEFPGVSFDQIYFPQMSWSNSPDDLLLGMHLPHNFQKVGSGFQTTMPPVITLAQVKKQVETVTNDFTKVKIIWDKYGFHVCVKE